MPRHGSDYEPVTLQTYLRQGYPFASYDELSSENQRLVKATVHAHKDALAGEILFAPCGTESLEFPGGRPRNGYEWELCEAVQNLVYKSWPQEDAQDFNIHTLNRLTYMLLHSARSIAQFYKETVPQIAAAIGTVSADVSKPGTTVSLKYGLRDAFKLNATEEKSAPYRVPSTVCDIVNKHYSKALMGDDISDYATRALYLAAKRIEPGCCAPNIVEGVDILEQGIGCLRQRVVAKLRHCELYVPRPH